MFSQADGFLATFAAAGRRGVHRGRDAHPVGRDLQTGTQGALGRGERGDCLIAAIQSDLAPRREDADNPNLCVGAALREEEEQIRTGGNPMKLQYYPDTDSLYIELSEKPSSDSQEITNGLVVDFDADGNVVGLDIDHASKKLAIGTLEAVALPVQNLKVG
jgi:uncharacterized protein YuzE